MLPRLKSTESMVMSRPMEMKLRRVIFFIFESISRLCVCLLSYDEISCNKYRVIDEKSATKIGITMSKLSNLET